MVKIFRLISALFIVQSCVQGCAAPSSKTPPQLDCAVLKKVIDAAPDNFSAIVSEKVETQFGAVWKTRTNAYGSNCSLVSSSNTPGQYFCSIPESEQATAMVPLVAAVETCLSPEWQRAALPAGSRFTRKGDNVIVDVGANDATASRSAAIGLIVRAPNP